MKITSVLGPSLNIGSGDPFESSRMIQSKETGKIGTQSPYAGSVYLIALGSNVKVDGKGPLTILKEALKLLEARGIVIRERSRFFNTPAFPAGSGPDFVNAAACIEYDGAAAQLLVLLHEIEAHMGRLRVVRWGARTLDLDLIAGGAQVLPDLKTYEFWRDLPFDVQQTAVPPELILPHPRLAERAFVLVPLLDVAKEWSHPVSGKSVREMHDALPKAARAEVVAL